MGGSAASILQMMRRSDKIGVILVTGVASRAAAIGYVRLLLNQSFTSSLSRASCMKIYTRTGDDGMAALYGGGRVAKNHPRMIAFGAVDELNSLLGQCRATGLSVDVDEIIARLQHEMFAIGAELATPAAGSAGVAYLDEKFVARLEEDVDSFESRLAPLKQFILPGGTPASAALHVARGVCRRAERETVALTQVESIRPVIIAYLNRVGDLLFVLARAENAKAGAPDVAWEKPLCD